MTLDLSTVKRIAVQCGAFVWKENVGGYAIGDAMFSAKQLALFSNSIYAMGAAEQKEKDAKICDSLAERDYCVDVRVAATAIRSQE